MEAPLGKVQLLYLRGSWGPTAFLEAPPLTFLHPSMAPEGNSGFCKQIPSGIKSTGLKHFPHFKHVNAGRKLKIWNPAWNAFVSPV